jgi:hypothetical protein
MKLAARRWAPGVVMMAIGALGWWYNWHLAHTAGYFYIKLCVLVPLALFGGLIAMMRPEWAGPLHANSPKSHKVALASLIAAIAVFSGVDMYRLKQTSPNPNSRTARRVPPRVMPPVVVERTKSVTGSAPSIEFLSKTYRLGAFNQRPNAMWEFVTSNESVDDWTTMLTVVDRPDASTITDLDRLAEGLMSTYKSHNGRILLAKTMQDDSGAPYNYLVCAFEQPDRSRFELNFVKMALGKGNAVVSIYGVRVADANDFRNQHSEEIGRALNNLQPPNTASLPRNSL